MAIPIGDGYGSVGSCGQATTVLTNTDQSLSPYSRAIYVSTDGNLQVTLAWDTASVTFAVLAGSFIPIRVKTVHAAPAGTLALW